MPPARKTDMVKLVDMEYAALAEFRRALRVFLAFSERASRKAGLTPQQHQAILAIRGLSAEGPMTVNDLAGHLLLRPQTAVGLADRLESAGLVRRTRDTADRRRVFLTLTAKAERRLETLSAAHLEQIARDAPALSAVLGSIAQRGEKQVSMRKKSGPSASATRRNAPA